MMMDYAQAALVLTTYGDGDGMERPPTASEAEAMIIAVVALKRLVGLGEKEPWTA